MARQLSGAPDGTQINHSGVLFGEAFLVFTFSDGKVVR